MIHIRGDLHFLSLRLGSWPLLFCNYIWTPWAWSEIYRFLRKKWRRVACLAFFFICKTSDYIITSVSFHPPHSVLLISNSLHFSVYPSILLCLSIPVWIPFSLILTSQTPTLRYPSPPPPPPPIRPVLLLLAWLIAETELILCRCTCEAYLTTTALLPPHAQPLCALITPHCMRIISGRDQILKHDGSVLVFKWSWSCWFLIRRAEDA